MTYRDRTYRRKQPDVLLSLLVGYALSLTFVLCAVMGVAAWNHYRTVIIIAGAEDDCPYTYSQRPLIDVVGIEQDGVHRVECRY